LKAIHILLTAALVLPVAACELDVTERIGGTPMPESARLFDAAGQELGPAIRLRSTWPSHVEFRLYDRRGNEVTEVPGHTAELQWGPPGAVHLTRVEGREHAYTVQVLNPCLQPRALRVGYGRARADERYFGPFPVEITHPIRNVRIFTATGAELTQAVRLPNARDLRLEFRLYNCAGQRITSLGEGEELRLYWAPDNAVAVGSVAGEPLQSTVFARLPAGDSAHVTVGIAREGEAPAQLFGPFSIVVIP
jgi:hypothetical protein